MTIFRCATCGHVVVPEQGNLIADDTTAGPRHWRIVHKGSCDPRNGPWYGLTDLTGKNGVKLFRALQKQGVFSSLTPEQMAGLQHLLYGDGI
jgi:hypothetical protein